MVFAVFGPLKMHVETILACCVNGLAPVRGLLPARRFSFPKD
jgi:hypothetical protein